MKTIKFMTLFMLIVGCASVQNPKKMTFDYQINWPPEYEPKESTFFVHNELQINAPAEVIWDVLIQAETWPQWYEGAHGVKVLNSADGILKADSVFTWNTMGLDFVSTIREFEKPYRLSWESDKWSIRGYHAWLIIPNEHGCRVITDESQFGLMAVLEGIFVPTKLRQLHDIWLLQIKNKAEALAAKPTASYR